MSSEYLKNHRRQAYQKNQSKGFKTHLTGNVFTTLQPQTKEYLKNKNITTIDFEKMDTIRKIALEIRELFINKKKRKIFDTIMIEFYNYAGITLDVITRGVGRSYVDSYVKYSEFIKTDEEKALLAALIIDPDLNYYYTYQNNTDDAIKALNQHYGFVSKELLEIERLYDCIVRYRDQGKDEESVKYIVKKLYNIDDRGPKR